MATLLVTIRFKAAAVFLVVSSISSSSGLARACMQAAKSTVSRCMPMQIGPSA
jgi:hypothetical protein